jgi:hypothetical protein
MNEADSGEVPKPAESFPERPRLGIRHLLLWTACAAVYLAMYQGFFAGAVDAFDRIYAILTALHSIAGGVLLMGVLFWLARRLQRVPFPSSEGEVLWLALGLILLADMARLPAIYWWTGGRGTERDVLLLITTTITFGILGLTAGVWLLIAIFRTRKRLWRALFGVALAGLVLKTFGCVSWFGFYFGPFSLMWFVLLTAGSLLATAALWQDWLRTPRPPWTHWAGTACCAWQCLLGLVELGAYWIADATRAMSI